jgi:hypothetical protein
MSTTEGEVMERAKAETAAGADFLAQLDRLAERLEATGAAIEQYRRERDALLGAAGVNSLAALAKRIERWVLLEEEHQLLLEQRREATERLQGLIDKVDRLQR